MLGIIRRRAPWIVLCVFLAAGAAYGVSKQKTKKYTAAAAVAFSNNPLSQQIAGLSSTSSSSNSSAEQESNIELVKLGDMAARTAKVLGHGLTEEQVAASLKISGRGESSIVLVSATSTSPTLAAATANTYVTEFVKEQQSSNRQFLRSALAAVNKQLARLSPPQRFGSDGLDLQTRAHTLTLLSELGYNNAVVAQQAAAPASPSSPQTKRNTILGAALGLLLGLGVVFTLERFDRRVRKPEELEAIYNLALLGTIPESPAISRSAGKTRRKRVALPPAEAEAFSLIRARLRFFNIDRDVRSVVIASGEQADGKTTVARHLAEAATRMGSRVLLLEADLRHPTLAKQLNLDPGPGLADVLIGAIPIGEAVQAVSLDAAPGEGVVGRSLEVLAAGAVLPPNPGELLESRGMYSVLEWARWAEYDLIVIDTPPLTAVSDAFPLLSSVDGVVIVGRIGRSRRDAAERLHQVLTSSGAPLLGVIANGSKSGTPHPYPNAGKSPPAMAPQNSDSYETLAPTTRS
jgi:polysaccharide biosynthesis transport protein